MIWVLEWLIFGHMHKWAEPSRQGNVHWDGQTVGYYRECRCEKCGVWREFRT